MRSTQNIAWHILTKRQPLLIMLSSSLKSFNESLQSKFQSALRVNSKVLSTVDKAFWIWLLTLHPASSPVHRFTASRRELFMVPILCCPSPSYALINPVLSVLGHLLCEGLLSLQELVHIVPLVKTIVLAPLCIPMAPGGRNDPFSHTAFTPDFSRNGQSRSKESSCRIPSGS